MREDALGGRSQALELSSEGGGGEIVPTPFIALPLACKGFLFRQACGVYAGSPFEGV